MERIPEPELMDDAAQAEAYASADFEEPHAHFVVLVRERLPGLAPSGAALDLGCGPADIAIRFARAFPGWSVDGIDASEPMLALGRTAVRRAGLVRRVSLRFGHLPEATAPRPRYDLVLSNSLLHHLRDPQALWTSARRCVTRDGFLFVMDLLRPDDRDEARRLVARYVAGEPEVLQRDFLRSLLAAYRPDEVRTQLVAAGLGHLDVVRTSDRHLIVCGRMGR